MKKELYQQNMTHYKGENDSMLALNYHGELEKTLDDKNKFCKKYLYDGDNDLQSLLIMMAVGSIESDVDSKSQTFTKTLDYEEHEPVTYSTTAKCNFNDISDILNITPIQTHIIKRQKYLIVKYVQRWKAIMKKNREDALKQKRQETVNNFLEKLRKKKCKSNFVLESSQKSKVMVEDFRTYQHRYKVQKHIIALQKAKLEEQTKVIEELKLNKIVEASNLSINSIKEGIRKTYFEMDRKLKPKIQCLSKELKITDFEEPTMVLHCLKMPQFLRRMEARAREREEKHALIRERRKQMEEERVRLKQQEELEKAEMDREEKNRRMKALREKRKREKIENIRKKQYAERMRALVVMAELHYERNLMSKYGIRPLKLLMKIKENNMEKAMAHYTFQVKKNLFLHWMWYAEDMWYERNYKADEFNRKKCLKKAFQCFKKIHHECVVKRQVAEDYYDLYITQLVFKKFREAINIIKAEYNIKWQKAINYHNSNLVFKTFTCWRTLPALNALKREQEIRKSKWRQKVLLVVPDYQPPEE